MKLAQLFEEHIDKRKVHAYFAKAPGPQDIPGMELRYLMPARAHIQKAMEYAKEEQKEGRVKELQRQLDTLKDRYFTGTLDWWKSRKEFDNGDNGARSMHKGQIEHEYPNLQIYDSKLDAVRAAEQDGSIPKK